MILQFLEDFNQYNGKNGMSKETFPTPQILPILGQSLDAQSK